MSVHESASGGPQARKAWVLFFSLPILSWAMYDFANTIFSSNIITIFYPFYLKAALGSNETMSQIASTFVTYSNAISSLFLVLLSPLFGVWIDRTGRKKPYLIPFTLLCIAATLLMGFAALWDTNRLWFGLNASIAGVVLCFMIAKFLYNSSLIFYDSMISDLGNAREIPLISGFGVAVGYTGTLVGLLVYPLVGDNHFERTFIPSALMFLLFLLPIWLWYREKPAPVRQDDKSLLSGYREIWATFKEARLYKAAFLFMIAYFFFNDAISTAIAVMAIYSKTVMAFSTDQFILLYLVSTVSSIVGSYVFGFISRGLGAKTGVSLVAALLIVALALASTTASQGLFWIAGSLYGISMGAMWVTSRTMIVELTPPEKRGQFFGLFAFSGKVSSIVGPALYGSITWALAEQGNLASRVALGSLIVLVVIGLFVHVRVPYGSKSGGEA
ncbi:MFS transporter [Paenibacillus athensensis]|uniref:MFS transporter n=1 Tax=Paenibacillus athensensis TaxID=1967502 RepID=A0A4Y8Q8M8_9BACL|nr:MFS transporter [Paenibacillus athensensis]MCD1260038.1 MFS transporter [Paenibacillus athensensis]